MAKHFLVRHVGNMGDMVFIVPPILETLKRRYPDCHITFVTAWGFKEPQTWLTGRRLKREGWGKRNQDGFCIALMMTNPHIDSLIHWHDTVVALDGSLCREEGRRFPTWSEAYYNEQKQSGAYDGVFELDFGLAIDDNPLQRAYEVIGLPDETYTKYQLYLTEADRAVAQAVLQHFPRPRIVLLESLQGITTRNWDPAKIPALEQALEKSYGVAPLWFGGKYVPEYWGRPLTLRENTAILPLCDMAIGVLSGPLHLAAAVGLPTLTLYTDHPIHRAAPAYFLNRYITDSKKQHRTLLGPSEEPMRIMKGPTASTCLTPAEVKQQHYTSWQQPGRQATKSGLAAITVDEVMQVVHDMVSV